MLSTFKTAIAGQFDAALATLHLCVEKCPESAWNTRIANLTWDQAVFHTLFYADFYLQRNSDRQAFREQAFHRERADVFADYEEFEDRPQQLHYDRAFIRHYLQHCRAKAAQTISAETQESLSGPSGFEWLTFSRAEAYLYNLRHVQHHAAQLILRLRLDFQTNMPWVKTGWREP